VKEIGRLCEEFDLIHCADPFKNKSKTKKLAYFRLHGKSGYKYKYTDSDLKELEKMCECFSEVYYMFNNVCMYEDALRFRKRVKGISKY